MPRVVRTLLVCAACLAPTLAPAQETEGSSAKPPALVATIGDLQGFIDQVGAFTGSVDPSMSPENLREAGAQFGDPGFQSFAKGAGIAFIAESPERMLLAIEAKGEAAAGYRGMLGAFGFVEQNDADAPGPIVAANAPGMVGGGAQVAALAALAAANKSHVALDLDIAQLYQQYGPRLKFMAGSIPSLMPSTGPELVPAARIVEAEARFALNMLEQTRHLGINLSFDKNGVTTAMNVTPVDGSRLAALITACSERPVDLGLLHRLPTDGGVRGAMGIPPQALGQFMKGEVASLLKDMQVEESAAKGIRQLTELTTRAIGSGWAMNFYGEGSLFDGSGIFHTSDPEALFNVYEEFARQMSDGPLGEMYAAMGQKWTFDVQRNARKIGDLPVHRMTSKMEIVEGSDMEALPPEMAKLFTDGFTMEFVAAAEDRMIMSMGGVPLEKLLDMSKAPTPTERLSSAASHGPGGFVYYDMDFGKVMKSMSAYMPTDGQGLPPEAFEAMTKSMAGYPLTFAGHAKGGTLRMAMGLPAKFFAAFVPMAAGGGGVITPHQQAELDFEDLTFACDKFEMDHDRWPTSWEELQQKSKSGTPYLATMPLDPWTGSRYQVQWDAPEYGPVFITYGEDRKPGGTGPNRDLRSDED